MKRCISVSFDYKGKEYFAIVRHRSVDHKGFYHIRIMNHRLDALINKHNLSMIEEKDGTLCTPETGSHSEDYIIQAAIVDELVKELEENDDVIEYVHISYYPLLTPF